MTHPNPPDVPADAAALLSHAVRLLATCAADTTGDDAPDRMLDAALPALGDFGFFDLIDGDTVRRTARVPTSPDLQARLAASSRWTLPDEAPVLHAEVDDAFRGRFATSPEQSALLRDLDVNSVLSVPVRLGNERLGALALFRTRASGRHHGPADLALAEDLAALAAPLVANARLVRQHAAGQAAEHAARAEADQARSRLELMATAATRLSGELQPQATLRAIAELLVPAVCDWVRIDLLNADGTLERAVTHHHDPARAQQAAAAAQRLRASSGTVGSMAWAVQTGRQHILNLRSPQGFESLADPAIGEFARLIGLCAACTTPLVARGRTLGAIALLQAESGRQFDAEDAALVAELAQRAALALDNARLYAEAEASRQQAEAANRTKDEFLAMLGHELRNPLAPIVTTLQLMALKHPAAFADERRLIERQVGGLVRLVDDLLDVSRIVRGDVRLRREHVRLADVLARAVEIAQPLCEARRHRLHLRLPEQPVQLLADAQRLAQVFANLLINAARYTPPEGDITLEAGSDASHCTVRVRDNGQGIEAERLPRVFELFYQGRQAAHRPDGGLGIGLALVQNFVQLHGGTVDAHSGGAGAGSEFVVRLPLEAPAGAPAVAMPDRAPGPMTDTPAAPPAPTGQRVLVVDDNRDAADSLAMLLEASGHQVRVSLEPFDALQQARQFRPQVAILDIGLPGMDGHELARRLRADRANLGCRLIALSGYGLPQDHQRSQGAGFSAHLVKPVDPHQLLDLLADPPADPPAAPTLAG